MRRLAGKALSLALLLSCSAQACLDDASLTLRAEERIEFSADAPLLLRLEQWNEDLRIWVEGASPRWVNGPGGRSGTDYLFLEPTAQGGSLSLCLYSTFSNAVAGRYRLTRIPVAPQAAEIVHYRRLDQAGEFWHEATAEGQHRAREAYAAVAEAGLEPGITRDATLLAALAASSLHRHAEAMAQLQALAGTANGDWDQRHRLPWLQGLMALRGNRPGEAGALLSAALTQIEGAGEARRADFRYDSAELRVLLAEAQIGNQALTEASATLDEALIQAAPDFRLLGHVHNNRGYLSIKLSEQVGLEQSERQYYLDLATDEHLKALYFAEQAGDPASRQLIENNLAVHYARNGERRKSLLHFAAVLEMLEEFDNPPLRAFLLANLSRYFQDLGDYSKAEVYLHQAMAVGQSGNDLSAGRNRCRLGRLLRQQDRAEQATDPHLSCYRVAEALDDNALQVEAGLELGLDYLHQEQGETAARWFEYAIARLPRLRDGNLSLRVWMAYADLLLRRGELELAEAAIGQALDARQDERQPGDEIEALVLALRIASAAGKDERAQALGVQAVEKIERLHAQLEPESVGPSWSSRTHAAFMALAGLYLDEYEDNPAAATLERLFNISERSRAIGLRQVLAANLPKDVETIETRRQQDLFSEIADLLAQESGTGAPPPMRLLQYHHKRDLIALARLARMEQLPVPAVRTLAQVQASLGADELILYYLVSGEELHLLSIGQRATTLQRLGSRAAFQALRDPVLERMSGLAGTPLQELQDLSDFLLPAGLPLEGVSKLWIVPHTGLYAIPFAALSPAGAESSSRPLIRDFRITLLPSLSLPSRNWTPAAADGAPLITVFADPAFAAQREQPTPETAGGLPPGWSANLTRLPFTALEAERIQERFSSAARLYTGEAANRSNLRSFEARNARILHLATHGYFNSALDDNVGLALSPVPDEDGPDDGFVTLTELFGRSFNNELVVISGCETGMGREHEGEGLNSLTRGFHANGARFVVSSLWPVSDRASAIFMAAFYAALSELQDLSAALQRAQQTLARDPVFGDPVYWAGYTLSSLDGRSAFPLSSP